MRFWFSICLRNGAFPELTIACLSVVLAGSVSAAETEMTAAEKEAEQAKAEDAAEAAGGEGVTLAAEKTVSGKLLLGVVVPDRPDIVGVLRTEKGQGIPLKLSAEGLVESLKPYHNKPVVLQGKFRNQGKYFVVFGVLRPPAATVEFQKEGGL